MQRNLVEKNETGSKKKGHLSLKFATKLNLCLLLCAVLPAVLTVAFFYSQLIDNTVSQMLKSRQSAMAGVEFSIENYMGNLSTVLDSVSGDSRLLEMLNASPRDIAEAQLGRNIELSRTSQLFQSATEAYLNEESVSAIKIYVEDSADMLNHLCAPESAIFFEPMASIQYSYWKGLMEITGEKSRIFSGYYLESEERTSFGNISYVRQVPYFRNDTKKIAYVVVYSYESGITEQLKGAANLDAEMYYLIDSNDYMVTLSENIADNFGLYMMDYDKWQAEYEEDHSFHLKNFGQGEDYVAAYSLRGTPWIMVWIIPRSSMVGSGREVLRNFLMLYAVLLVAIFLLVWWIVHQLLGRLMKLKNHMNTVRDESPKVYTEDPGTDEIGELIDAYNYMIRQNDLLHKQEVENLNELNQLKVEAMRSQIDPHFLYNTLDMIRWLSANGNQADVEKAIKLLSRFYRLTTNNGNQLIQVKHELEHVELYMELMNMRFHDKISFVIDVSDEMMDFEIPVLIFQPIVENAISHGIFEKEDQAGCISIIGWMDEEYLHFEVADDGVGMTEERLQKVLAEQSRKKAGIGVFNTRRRLRILYNDRADLVYHTSVGNGTEVEYVIPVQVPPWVEVFDGKKN